MDRKTDSRDFIGPPTTYKSLNHKTNMRKYLGDHRPGKNSVSLDQQLPRMYF